MDGVEILRNFTPPDAKPALPFEELQPGDAMWVPGREARSLGLTCNAAGRQLGRKFEARTHIRDGVRGSYIVCKEGAPPPPLQRRIRTKKPATPLPAQAAE